MSIVPAIDLRTANDLHPNDPGAHTLSGLPHSIDAEQALLGVVLYDNAAFHDIDAVEPSVFAEPLHVAMWGVAAGMISKGVLCDLITLAERFTGDPAFEELGGLFYLSDLVDRAPPVANAPHYARLLKQLAQRRDLIQLAGEVSQGAREAADPGEVVSHASRALAEIELGASGSHWTSAGAAVRAAIEHARTRTGRIDYPTGIASLDSFTGGMNAGEMTILAARTGMGKTVAALTIARANAEIGRGVCVFSLEMTRQALGMRLACDVAYERGAPIFSGVPTCPTFDRAMKGELDDSQWRAIGEAQDQIDLWPLDIDDRSGLNMGQIEAAARRRHREWRRRGIEPGPVVIDHLGKVRPTTDRRGNKSAEVADVSNEAMNMAKRLGVPVLALVQLNRAVESRDDKRPQLSDLRQAGELEEDARQVMFLYRPEYYFREAKTDENFEERTERMEKLDACRRQLFWLIEKNSHGPRGQVQSFCEIGCSAIREW